MFGYNNVELILRELIYVLIALVKVAFECIITKMDIAKYK